MIILAIETSSDACSIALRVKDQIFQKHEILPQQHGHIILGWLSELLTEAKITTSKLNAVAYSCGPGSFTGIRIGASLGQGIALAHDIPLIAVPSLNVIAQGIYTKFGHSNVMVILDARVGQVYYGHSILGPDGLMIQDTPDQLTSLDKIPTPINQDQPVLVTDIVNTEFQPDFLDGFSNVVTDFYPSAANVLLIADELIRQGNATTLDEALPLYLRTENAWKKVGN